MADSDHEEADTRIVLHMNDSLQGGAGTILVRTVDTDVMVILIGQFHAVISRHPNAALWVIAFGTGKHFCYYSINTICAHLGEVKSRCLPPFHAFTGCDTTSTFFGKTKRSAWNTWNAFSHVNAAFLHMAENAFGDVSASCEFFSLLERFTVLLYDKSSVLNQSMKQGWSCFARKIEVWKIYPPTQVMYESLCLM